MIVERKDPLDMLIEDIIKEELDEIHIDDGQIQEEWYRLQGRLDEIDRKRKFLKPLKICAGVAVALALVFVGRGMNTEEIFAGKTGHMKTNIQKFDDKIVANLSTTLSPDESTMEEESTTVDKMEMSIEDAREVVNFQFKEFPYKLMHAIITNAGNDHFVVELEYETEKGEIRLTQWKEGIQSASTIGVPKDSIVENFTLDSTEYLYILIRNQMTEVEWSSFGIRYTMSVRYKMTQDEVKVMVKELR